MFFHSVWFARIKDLVYEYKFDSAEKFCQASTNSYSKVVEAGLGQVNNDIEAVQTAMQGEATQQVARMEKHLNWLSITASVTPTTQSEERRVGKECRSRWSPYH